MTGPRKAKMVACSHLIANEAIVHIETMDGQRFIFLFQRPEVALINTMTTAVLQGADEGDPAERTRRLASNLFVDPPCA